MLTLHYHYCEQHGSGHLPSSYLLNRNQIRNKQVLVLKPHLFSFAHLNRTVCFPPLLLPPPPPGSAQTVNNYPLLFSSVSHSNAHRNWFQLLTRDTLKHLSCSCNFLLGLYFLFQVKCDLRSQSFSFFSVLLFVSLEWQNVW